MVFLTIVVVHQLTVKVTNDSEVEVPLPDIVNIENNVIIIT